MTNDMEVRLKMAEEYIHQRYLDDCKECGWDIIGKAKHYLQLPPSMHDPALDIMAGEEFSEFLQVLFYNFREYKLIHSKDYEQAYSFIKQKQPKWLLLTIEKAVDGPFGECLNIIRLDIRYLLDADLLGDGDNYNGRVYRRAMTELYNKYRNMLDIPLVEYKSENKE